MTTQEFCAKHNACLGGMKWAAARGDEAELSAASDASDAARRLALAADNRLAMRQIQAALGFELEETKRQTALIRAPMPAPKQEG